MVSRSSCAWTSRWRPLALGSPRSLPCCAGGSLAPGALPFFSAQQLFASLMPLGCSQLHSYDPYTSCQSLSGFSWGFWAGQDTLWWHVPVLTVQVVMVGAALAEAMSVAAVVVAAGRANRSGQG
jgi:hypothetical protein